MKTIEERAESVAIFKKFGEGMDEKDVVLHNVLQHGRREGYIIGAKEQKAIDDERFDELMEYLEELESHYRKLRQYDDGKPIRRVISYIKSKEDK